ARSVLQRKLSDGDRVERRRQGHGGQAQQDAGANGLSIRVEGNGPDSSSSAQHRTDAKLTWEPERRTGSPRSPGGSNRRFLRLDVALDQNRRHQRGAADATFEEPREKARSQIDLDQVREQRPVSQRLDAEVAVGVGDVVTERMIEPETNRRRGG